MQLVNIKTTDKIFLTDDKIYVVNDFVETTYNISDINRISVFTTDKGPFVDDVFLVLTIAEVTIIVPSEHPLYKTFLFDELGNHIKIDYQKIIDSAVSVENKEFVLFKKETN